MARLLIVEDNPELANLVAAAARTRGHDAVTASTGEQARTLIQDGAFEAAIVDLLLPDLRGGEVLQALKSKGIPAVAVSGVYRGDKYAKEAVEVHGAKAFFEKPFLMSTVLLAAETAAGIVPRPQSAPRPDDLEELEELAPIEDVPSAPEQPATPDSTPNIALPFAERDRVWAKTQPAPEQKPRGRAVPPWAQSGFIAQSPVPRLLGAYYQARHEGELKLRQGTVMKVVYFEAGRPAYAASNLITERFARFAVRKGVASEKDMTAVAQLAREQSLRTGDAMVKLGLITQEQRRKLLEDQVKEIIWSTFGWTTGEYSFLNQRPSRSDVVKLSIFPGDLVLEGTLKSMTLPELRKRMPLEARMSPTADPPYALHELRLDGTQARLLAYCDGTKTVDDLVQLVDAPERDVLAVLVAFALMGLIEPRQDDAKRRERISYGL